MSEMGFFIGEGVIGRERCRQKFSNLQTSYIKAKQRQKKTGEGNVIFPPFYEELDELLSDNHKVNPVLVIDTYDVEKNPEGVPEGKSSGNNVTLTSEKKIEVDSSQPSTSSSSNRFKISERTLRPNKPNIIEAIKTINKENQEVRKNEFKSMLEAFNKESNQRHIEIMALINVMTNRSKGESKGKKRTRNQRTAIAVNKLCVGKCILSFYLRIPY